MVANAGSSLTRSEKAELLALRKADAARKKKHRDRIKRYRESQKARELNKLAKELKG
jgi:hypothetical protein